MDQKHIKEATRVAEGGGADQSSRKPGDNRTPDKIIGQVKYADNEGGSERKKQGGAGDPQTSPMEPEKQGGIGGP